MPATTQSLLTSITTASSNAGFSVWKRDGAGGTPSAVSETDTYVWGTGACSVKVSNQGIVLAYGTGGLNLSAAGTHLAAWAVSLVGSLMANRANNGLCLFASSDATLTTGANYKMWAVDGGDTYPGGTIKYVIDLSKTATVSVGTLNLADVRWVGFYCDTRPNAAKFDNLILGPIDYFTGHGLRVYGTSTTDDLFGDVFASAESTGMISEKEGIYYLRAGIDLGDEVGTNSASLTDVDKILVFEDPMYYNGASVVSCLATGVAGLHITGNATGTTSVQFGKKVGTGDSATGRNGLTVIGRGPGVSFAMSNANVDSALIYGTKFEGILGSFEGSSNTSHEFIGNQINGCGQFDPVGGVIVRDLTCVGYAGTGGALLWNASIDIKNSSFIANTDGTNDPAGIEIPAAISGPISLSGLKFSGNDYDLYWRATSGTLTTNNTDGANAATWKADGTATVSIQGAISLSFTVQDASQVAVAGAQVYVDEDNVSPFILSSQTNGTGQVSGSYSGAPVTATLRVRKYGYRQLSEPLPLGAADISRTITLAADPQQS